MIFLIIALVVLTSLNFVCYIVAYKHISSIFKCIDTINDTLDINNKTTASILGILDTNGNALGAYNRAFSNQNEINNIIAERLNILSERCDFSTEISTDLTSIVKTVLDSRETTETSENN